MSIFPDQAMHQYRKNQRSTVIFIDWGIAKTNSPI
jgi:DNA primase